jgi:hypothetical protein
MPKTGKSIINKRTHLSSKKNGKKNIQPAVQKIMVGEDEFCPTCMEWRAYDEVTGKCKVCGRIIKKIGYARKITDEFDLKDFGNDHDEPQETEEF